MKQLATVINPEDFREFTIRAAQAEVSRRELLRRIVQKYLAKNFRAPGIARPRTPVVNKPPACRDRQKQKRTGCLPD